MLIIQLKHFAYDAKEERQKEINVLLFIPINLNVVEETYNLVSKFKNKSHWRVNRKWPLHFSSVRRKSNKICRDWQHQNCKGKDNHKNRWSRSLHLQKKWEWEYSATRLLGKIPSLPAVMLWETTFSRHWNPEVPPLPLSWASATNSSPSSNIS